MNKDFEKAYKELAEIDVPDLWDRIEAGLSEKSAPEAEKKRNSFIIFAKRYSALAAAIVCVVIIIPAMIAMKQTMGSKSYSEGTSMDSAASEAFDIAETTEEAAEMAEEAAEMAEEFVREESADEAPAMEEAASADDWSVTGSMAQKSESSMDALTEEQNEAESGLTENTVKDLEENRYSEEERKQKAAALENVIVRITETEEWSKGESIEETGALCTAVVQNDPSGTLIPGENIDIFIPAISSIALMKDGTFELDLALWEEEEDIYRIVKYHRQLEEQTVQ